MRDQDVHTVKGKQADIALYELVWQESTEELTTLSTRPVARPARLRLTHGDRTIELDGCPADGDRRGVVVQDQFEYWQFRRLFQH